MNLSDNLVYGKVFREEQLGPAQRSLKRADSDGRASSHFDPMTDRSSASRHPPALPLLSHLY